MADIEAANHRLASALHLKDEEKSASSPSPEERDTEAVASAGSEDLFHPRDGDSGGEKQAGLENLWKGQPKPQTCRGQSQAAQHAHNNSHTPAEVAWNSAEGHPPNHPPQTATSGSQVAQPGSAHLELTQNADASPGLGPLSPQSCDLSLWTLSDISTCTQGHKSVGDISESQWSEIVDLLGVGGPDRAYAEVEACFESICACRGVDGQEPGSAEFEFDDFFDSFIENPGETALEGGRSHGDACEYMFEDGHGCQDEDSVSTAHVVVEQQLPASLSYRGDGSELQACRHPRGEGPCTLFEGVAQSFAVPLHHSRPRAIPTLPREEDWPFPDILEDRASMYG